ncbi:MAG: hypothetical protein LBM99_01100 [Bacillales bacterium]|jgi:hypothetical protein|nr:hypothetical protein [Bacillales bacterium]
MSLNKETIIKRKSIRSYDFEPLSTDMLDKIKNIISEIKPLYNELSHFEIVSKKEYFQITQGPFRVSAPYYLACYSLSEPQALVNLGYLVELIVLKLTDLDLGTVILGTNSKAKYNDLDFQVGIAFGTPKEEFRKDIKDAKRRNLNEIFKGDVLDIAPFINVAPSALNLQPILFEVNKNEIDVYRIRKLNLMKALDLIQYLDVGIAISHFNLVNFKIEDRKKTNEKNKTYITTIILEI